MEKLKIYSYNHKFPEKFKKEKNRISKVIKNCEIYHIGSTAVFGLGGKGIIDMMIAVNNWKETNEIIKKLKKLGFNHIHPKEKSKIFLSKNQTLSLNNVHIHIVKKGSKQFKDFLAFRNYFLKNKKEIKKLSELKFEWLKESNRDRSKYNKLKAKYIREIL